MSNIGWLFYKDYFKGIDYSDLGSDSNKKLIQSKVDNIINQSVTVTEEEMLGNVHLKATTTYPGLLLGSGNAHELPSIEGQAILGFHFDYTTGLPVIQGSSIKGVLRSAFQHESYIREILKDDSINVQDLASEIFDNGDVFFDATVISEGKILGDDYLTPHDVEGFKDPIPLRFIKVLPNVTFRFDFEIKSDKNRRIGLFKTILSDLGLGAKTNVGYGKFVDFKKMQTQEEIELEKAEREEESFQLAIKSNSLEELEAFKRDFPKSEKNLDEAIEKIKVHNKNSQIETAYANLIKTNKTHVDKFIEKYENDPDANSYVEKAKQLFADRGTGGEKGKTINDLASVTDTKQFKAVLDALDDISDEERKIIEENVIRLYGALKKNRKKNFFKEIQLERFVDTDFQNKMKKALGAK